ncbi:hypothetical protein UCRPA7_6001 [Phaeoacremonium minimum UCRPA7]|uniref:Uncharacterized protein n=1 Tax=Phaeoacremonium minimum (strain UCR-PA7) TaxID=1286976 RepID=R8BGP5_PHAM7|nr:hypothetical protein UCRPA7_6001 [Phaeoacremonium minimum UCRPA7]EON98459.1 hypothetical protein UCRPA7_6001 [Phaeoacremonium minimum UCRPA7]
MVKRTTLTPTTKKRRHSTPARSNGSGCSGIDSADPFVTAIDSPFCGEVTFLPLRQVLDGRVKRRIRRNGLSEEMNTINAEKRRRAQQTKAEIEALKAEVAAKDAEIQRLHDETIVQDTDRIVELEQRIDELRSELASRSGVRINRHDESTHIDWTLAARDPFSDELMDLDMDHDGDDEDEFGETTMADIACSTPTRRVSARNSFPTPPSTSPAPMPMTPCSHHMSTPKSNAGVQVSMPDTEKQHLEDELASLQLEVCKLTTTLETYSAMTSRITEKLSPFATEDDAMDENALNTNSTSAADSKLETHLNTLLRTLSDRTAALTHLSFSLNDLGFPGNDASEVIASLSTAFRTARLELEYLTPGEIPLPLTSAGAAVLDLLLTKLRDLARKSRENDDAIDEYHALELSLRQQLGARVEAMDGMSREMKALEGDAKQKDARIADLEIGIERLKGAVKSYARDVSELEALVGRMEGELQTANAQNNKSREDHEADMKEWTDIFTDKQSCISTLETKLSDAMAQTSELKEQLSTVNTQHAELQSKHKDEVALLNKAHGSSLALRDARVSELRLEIDRVNDALRAAHETVRQLRVDNGSLSKRLDDEKNKAKAAIDTMKAELERVVRMSQDFLATPKKSKVLTPGRRSRSGSLDGRESEGMPATVVRPAKLLAGDLARRTSDGGKGKKRRRYDSGLGFLDEEEIDVDA